MKPKLMKLQNLIPRDTTVDSENFINIVSRKEKLHLSEVKASIFCNRTICISVTVVQKLDKMFRLGIEQKARNGPTWVKIADESCWVSSSFDLVCHKAQVMKQYCHLVKGFSNALKQSTDILNMLSH